MLTPRTCRELELNVREHISRDLSVMAFGLLNSHQDQMTDLERGIQDGIERARRAVLEGKIFWD